MDVTIKGIPVEKLLEVYEKYSAGEKIKSRDAKYRETHKEELSQKNREYYQRRKEARQAAQASLETQAGLQPTPENNIRPE
jgi:major membrane immunogen (membrane-anchored lipoprotein)